MSRLYSAESVTSGHPDKVCDQISDAILDAYLAQDPLSRVAVETFGSKGLMVIGGEVTSKGSVDATTIARKVYSDIGYLDRPKVIVNISQQSPDIALGVNTGGAGDQGIMYGYATDETKEYLPLSVVLAHRLTQGLQKLRETNSQFSWLKPDGKSQITTEGLKVKSVLISCQHDEKISLEEIRQLIIKHLVIPTISPHLTTSPASTRRPLRLDRIEASLWRGGQVVRYEILVNPTGRFIQGGFAADTGLTGRKIMVDTYGGLIPHGGGAFSGKDATKVDRSAAYMCRLVAKNIVANGYAKKCLVSVAYAIGRQEPLMIEVDTFGTGKDAVIKKFVRKKFDFSPLAIIETLGLRQPIFQQTATYGHFGKSHLPWEKIISI